MAETTAVRRAEEPIRPIKYGSLFDQLENTFNTIARRAYEIFEANGRAFGRDLEHWFRAERELLHPVLVNVTETDGSFEMKAEVPGDYRQTRSREKGEEGQDGLGGELLRPDPPHG